MKDTPVIRLCAILLGLAIAGYCAACAYGIQLQADRDRRTLGVVLALGVYLWGLLMGGGFVWAALKPPRK